MALKGLIFKGLLCVSSATVGGGGTLIYADHSPKQEINKKLNLLSLPYRCNFHPIIDSFKNSKECYLYKEDLKKINFKGKDQNKDLILGVEGEDFSGMKLEIKKLIEKERKSYDYSIDLKFTFKGFDKTVTLKENQNTEVVKLVKGTNPEFKINNNKLEKSWTAQEICKKVGLECTDGKVTITKESEIRLMCQKDGIALNYQLSDGYDNTTNNITITKDTEDYNQGFKITFPTQVYLGLLSEDYNADLRKDYQIKYEYDEFADSSWRGWYLIRKTNWYGEGGTWSLSKCSP